MVNLDDFDLKTLTSIGQYGFVVSLLNAVR